VVTSRRVAHPWVVRTSNNRSNNHFRLPEKLITVALKCLPRSCVEAIQQTANDAGMRAFAVCRV